MRAFIASLFATAAFANHEAQEMAVLTTGNSGYGLDVWAVTGKRDFESQNIDTWFFGLELTTPVGTQVYGASATAKELGKEDKSDAYDFVGNNGEVYQTYVQFVDPNTNSSTNYESFSCSRVLSVTKEVTEFMIEDEDGYEVPQSFEIVTETIGDAEIVNYFGTRALSEGSPNNNNNYANQLIAVSSGRNTIASNQVDSGIWTSEPEINSTVFLQQGYKSGTRKFNCVAQRNLEVENSVYPKLEAGQTQLEFVAGYKIFPSTTDLYTVNQASTVKKVTVMDGAMSLAATTVVAAASLLAF